MSLEPQAPTPAIVLRPPASSDDPAAAEYNAPSLSFLKGTWHVTHSTLPMWKSKRNVRIAYDFLPPSTPSLTTEQTDRLDDLVTYQSLTSEKVQTIHGVDKASGSTGSRDVWDWRGKGWLMIASSHWEVLGWGEEQNEGGDSASATTNDWVITYFAKTLFTPAGIDIYSRKAQRPSEGTVQGIKDALARMKDESITTLAKDIFEIQMDNARDA